MNTLIIYTTFILLLIHPTFIQAIVPNTASTPCSSAYFQARNVMANIANTYHKHLQNILNKQEIPGDARNFDTVSETTHIMNAIQSWTRTNSIDNLTDLSVLITALSQGRALSTRLQHMRLLKGLQQQMSGLRSVLNDHPMRTPSGGFYRQYCRDEFISNVGNVERRQNLVATCQAIDAIAELKAGAENRVKDAIELFQNCFESNTGFTHIFQNPGGPEYYLSCESTDSSAEMNFVDLAIHCGRRIQGLCQMTVQCRILTAASTTADLMEGLLTCPSVNGRCPGPSACANDISFSPSRVINEGEDLAEATVADEQEEGEVDEFH